MSNIPHWMLHEHSTSFGIAGTLLLRAPTSPNLASFEPPSYPDPASFDDFIFEVRAW